MVNQIRYKGERKDEREREREHARISCSLSLLNAEVLVSSLGYYIYNPAFCSFPCTTANPNLGVTL